MPIYEYRCSSCGTQKDVMQKMSAAPLSTCPECSQETFARQISAAGFQLKGDGYYVTDFKNSGQPKVACAPCASSSSCPVANS